MEKHSLTVHDGFGSGPTTPLSESLMVVGGTVPSLVSNPEKMFTG